MIKSKGIVTDTDSSRCTLVCFGLLISMSVLNVDVVCLLMFVVCLLLLLLLLGVAVCLVLFIYCFYIVVAINCCLLLFDVSCLLLFAVLRDSLHMEDSNPTY